MLLNMMIYDNYGDDDIWWWYIIILYHDDDDDDDMDRYVILFYVSILF